MKPEDKPKPSSHLVDSISNPWHDEPTGTTDTVQQSPLPKPLENSGSDSPAKPRSIIRFVAPFIPLLIVGILFILNSLPDNCLARHNAGYCEGAGLLQIFKFFGLVIGFVIAGIIALATYPRKPKQK